MAQQFIPPSVLANLPKKLNVTIVPASSFYPGSGRTNVFVPEQYKTDSDYQGITPIFKEVPSFRTRKQAFDGFKAPLDPSLLPATDPTNHPMPTFYAYYDKDGNFQKIQPENPYQVNDDALVQPEINANGELVNLNVGPVNRDDGGFFSSVLRDFGPMILAGLGANLFTGANLLGEAGAAEVAGGSGALSPYASQAAGAYGGSAAAAEAAAAGNLAGIQQASAAQNALNLGIPTGGGAVTQGQDIAQLQNQLANTPMPPVTSGTPIAGEVVEGALPEVAPEVAPDISGAMSAGQTPYETAPNITADNIGKELTWVRPDLSGAMSAGQTPYSVAPEITASNIGQMAGTGLLDSLGDVGKSILDFAKANPSIAGSLLGAVTGAIGSATAPKSQTSTTTIDPQIKAEYLANLERAKQTAADLQARQIAQPGQLYTDAEKQLYNLGMTPFGAADIAKFYNPYQEQVVQGALGDIERARQMQEQANMAQATAAKAFGGSRQGVVSGMTNEAALRQAATTGSQLRQQGFTQAANLGLAARPLDIAGLQTSLGLGTTRTALEQARLDALRNLGTERLAITGGALGLQPANVGQTSSQPLYSSTAGSLLSGGLTGAYIGSLLGKA